MDAGLSGYRDQCNPDHSSTPGKDSLMSIYFRTNPLDEAEGLDIIAFDIYRRQATFLP